MNEWMIGEWMGSFESQEGGYKGKFSKYLKIDSTVVGSSILLKHHLRAEYYIRGPRFCLKDVITTWTGVITQASSDGLRTDFKFDSRNIRADTCNEVNDENLVKLFTDTIVGKVPGKSITLATRWDPPLTRYNGSNREIVSDNYEEICTESDYLKRIMLYFNGQK